MDGERFDGWTRGLDDRISRRGLTGAVLGATAAFGFAPFAEARRKKKKKKKKKKKAPAGGGNVCAGRNHCEDETLAGKCGTHDSGVFNCFCYKSLATGEHVCGRSATVLSVDCQTSACVTRQGGVCVDLTGCSFGPVGCTIPCSDPD